MSEVFAKHGNKLRYILVKDNSVLDLTTTIF